MSSKQYLHLVFGIGLLSISLVQAGNVSGKEKKRHDEEIKKLKYEIRDLKSSTLESELKYVLKNDSIKKIKTTLKKDEDERRNTLKIISNIFAKLKKNIEDHDTQIKYLNEQIKSLNDKYNELLDLMKNNTLESNKDIRLHIESLNFNKNNIDIGVFFNQENSNKEELAFDEEIEILSSKQKRKVTKENSIEDIGSRKSV